MQLDTLLAGVRNNRVEGPTPALFSWDPGPPSRSSACGDAADNNAETILYRNRDASLGIDFEVIRLPFSGLQVMDPRLVRIAPGSRNEKHRHAHESIFVVLSGLGEIQIGSGRTALSAGHVAYVPR